MAIFEVEEDAGVIKSVPNLLTRFRRLSKSVALGEVWLRGLQDKEKHKLLPSIGREYEFAGQSFSFNEKSEEQLLQRFRRYAYKYISRPLRRWEAIVLARHHGLPVRLMDWTLNPLAALYFACEFAGGGTPPDGKIWMLIPKDGESSRINVFSPPTGEDGEEKGPVHTRGIRLIDPMVISERIYAQSACFTIQDDPWKPLDSFGGTEFCDQRPLDILRLEGFTVPADKKPVMLKYLNSIGINRRTLFPDLDGLTQGLVNDQILRVDPRLAQ